MVKGREGKRAFLIFTIGVGLLGILYGWLVYAGEIDTDLNALASQVSANSKGTIALNPAFITMEQAEGTQVEQLLVDAINSALYGDNSAQPATVVSNHFGAFCSQKYEGGNCSDDILIQMGDAKASSILSGTLMSSDRQKAANAFLYNFLPPPQNNLNKYLKNGTVDAASFTQPDTQKVMVDALTDQAVLSVARQSFAEMIAKRTQASSGGSMMQFMEAQAVQRLFSQNWTEQINNKKGDDLQRERALMQAYQLWLQYQQYRQMERIEALLSAMVVQNYKSSQMLKAQTNMADTQQKRLEQQPQPQPAQ